MALSDLRCVKGRNSASALIAFAVVEYDLLLGYFTVLCALGRHAFYLSISLTRYYYCVCLLCVFIVCVNVILYAVYLRVFNCLLQNNGILFKQENKGAVSRILQTLFV